MVQLPSVMFLRTYSDISRWISRCFLYSISRTSRIPRVLYVKGQMDSLHRKHCNSVHSLCPLLPMAKGIHILLLSGRSFTTHHRTIQLLRRLLEPRILKLCQTSPNILGLQFYWHNESTQMN